MLATFFFGYVIIMIFLLGLIMGYDFRKSIEKDNSYKETE